MTARFHERFEIEVGIDEAKRRFVNRAKNSLRTKGPVAEYWAIGAPARTRVTFAIANAVGEELVDYTLFQNALDRYVGHDLYRCLQAIEACWHTMPSWDRDKLGAIVETLLQECEVDLGIRWENGKFLRSGAGLLDQELVNEPLRWLADPKYENVRVPFQKGLTHFVNAEKQPQLLSDVITDMYEALETLSKIVTERPEKDLSANRELLIKKIGASDQYKTILKDYIDYACEFRHGVGQGQTKPTLTQSEVESFVYLTGLFIRLAITST